MSVNLAESDELKSTIKVALVAVDEDEFGDAEDALTDALGEVRKRKGGSR